MRTFASLGFGLLALSACHSKDATPTVGPEASRVVAEAPRAAAAPGTKLGSAITETTVTPLSQIVAEPARFVDKVVRTEGLVTGVCQAKGCWMEIGDEAGTAHVKFAGYAFFVPRSASGKRAVVQGKLVPTADSCASKDGCREAGEKASGQVAKVDLEATGVELLD